MLKIIEWEAVQPTTPGMYYYLHDKMVRLVKVFYSEGDLVATYVLYKPAPEGSIIKVADSEGIFIDAEREIFFLSE